MSEDISEDKNTFKNDNLLENDENANTKINIKKYKINKKIFYKIIKY